MRLPVVLHPDIVDFLRKIPEKTLQERIWNCIQKLRQQRFDGGLRVKKLKGMAKRIWEARINQASRLIFTYEKSRKPETGKAQVYIAIQDICLDHDDVSRRARARKNAADAEWLDSAEVEASSAREGEELAAGSLSRGELFEADEEIAIAAARAEEMAIAADFRDGLLSNIPWQVIESKAQWRQAIVQQATDLPLKLTPEEYQLAKLPGNLLLSGSAGTGKTTVALYRLLHSLQDAPSGKRLYVAYNPLLVSNAREQFKLLAGKSKADLETFFQFKTVRDLCLEILDAAGQSQLAENEVNFMAFWQMYRAHPKRKQYPTTLVWDEIRSIIKGAQLSLDAALLPKKEYENLGKKRSTVIPQNQRRDVYELAEWYQKKLKQDGRFDEIDLARKVLQLVKQNATEPYHFIVCDEVQDLTELHLELLFQLRAPGGHFFFAGDLHQTISPSGFRWEDLKMKFYRSQQEVIEKSLYYNFRSVGTLVNLAAQLLRLRSRLLKVSHGEVSSPTPPTSSGEAQQVSSFGEQARLIAAAAESLKQTLDRLNPGDAILVRTDEEKDKFSQDFESTLVFTIEEAKGLEFDTVFLVEFFKSAEEMWAKLFRTGSVSPKETPQLQLELNLLYVAVTRARRILNIWESHLSEVWSQPELLECVLPLNPELVQQHRVEPTAESWRERGLYYLKAEFYSQAIECFEKAGDRVGLQQANARLLVQKRQYLQAAEAFAEVEEWETAAGLFEKEKQWQRAAQCWAKANNRDKQALAEIWALEAAQCWEEAAQHWEELAREAEAKRCWLRSNNDRKKAEIRAMEFAEKKQWLKAAEQYEIARMPQKAGECRGLEWEKKQQWDKAAVEYELAGNSEKARECRLKIPVASGGDANALGERGNDLLNNGDFHGAIACYDEALRIEPKLGYLYNNRGVAYHRLEDYKRAVEDYDRAIELLGPKDARIAKTYGFRGAARSAMGDHAGAVADYTEVLKLLPNDATAYNNRAATRHRLGDYQGAIEDYTAVVRIDPSNALAYGNRGAAQSAKGDHAAAIADFTRALQVNPAMNEVYFRRGKSRAALEDYEGAIADFNEELKRNSSLTQVYYQRGKAYLALKNYEPALADFNIELQRNPNSADAYNDRGIARSALGDTQGAIDDYNRAIAINPNFAAAYNNRGCGRRDLGDTPASIGDFDYAIGLNPNYADAYYNRGVSRTLLDDVKGAIEDWQKSVQLKGNNPIAYYNMALGKSKLGDQEGALLDYTQAIEIKACFPEAYYNRAIVHYKMGDIEKAIADFQSAAEKYSERGDTEGYNHTLSKIQKLMEKAEEDHNPDPDEDESDESDESDADDDE